MLRIKEISIFIILLSFMNISNIYSATKSIAVKKEELSPEREAKIETANKLLLDAVKNNNVEKVKEALANGADINIQDNYGATALMYASEKGHTAIVQLLLNEGANVNIKNTADWTALMYASVYGSAEIVQLLLEKKADVAIKNNKGWTALVMAQEMGHSNVVQLLTKHRAEFISHKFPHELETRMLLSAISSNRMDLANEAIKDGAEINTKNEHGNTALLFAIKSNRNDKMVPLLLENKADVNIKDNDGNTALLIIAARGYPNLDLVELLLKYGADVSIKNNEGKTALDYINEKSGLQKIYNDYRNKQVNELINLAKDKNFKQIKEILIKSPHLINQTKQQGESLLNQAILFKNYDLIKLLFEDPEIKIKPNLLAGGILSEENPVVYAENLGRPGSDPQKKIWRDIAEYLRKQRDIQEKK